MGRYGPQGRLRDRRPARPRPAADTTTAAAAALDAPRPDVASPLPPRCCRDVDRSAHRGFPAHHNHLRLPLPLRGDPVTTTQSLATDVAATTGLPPCVTQDPREPAHRDYLAICAIHATEIADSIHCPPECGGHPVCRPCLALAVERGLVVHLGSL
jgi:hypothetical protein